MDQEVVIYNADGEACLRVMRDGTIFDYAGTPRGFVHSEVVYDYGGQQVGWFTDGYLRDRDGCAIGFCQNHGIGPLPPLPQLPPLPALNAIPPLRPIPAVPSVRPIPQLAWSDLDIDDILTP